MSRADDGFGNVVTPRDPAGLVTTNTYDAAGNGNLVEASTPMLEDAGKVRKTTFVRADAAHPDDVTGIVPPAEQGKPAPKTWRFGYDPSTGYRSFATDPEGNRSEFGFDSVGRPLWMVASKGVATPGVPDDYRTTFTNNEFGDVIAVSGPAGVDPDGTWVGYGYDLEGRLVSLRYPNGQTVARSSDAAGRFVSTTHWGARTDSFGYDPNSNLDRITFPSGSNNVDTYGFDQAHRVTSAVFKRGSTTRRAQKSPMRNPP